jgi:phosphatidylglycerophosphate synthase
MKYQMKYRDILKSYSEKKKISDFNSHFFLYYLYRPLSFGISYVFVKLGIKTNTVTFLTFFFGPLLVYSNYLENKIGSIIAFTGSFFFYVFDCVDGNMARIYKQASKKGEFLDSLSGIIFSLFVYLFFSLRVQNHGFWIQVIPLCSFCCLLISRYQSLRYLKDKKEKEEKVISFKSILKSIPDLLPFFIILSFYGLALQCVLFLGFYNFLGLLYITKKILDKN